MLPLESVLTTIVPEQDGVSPAVAVPLLVLSVAAASPGSGAVSWRAPPGVRELGPVGSFPQAPSAARESTASRMRAVFIKRFQCAGSWHGQGAVAT